MNKNESFREFFQRAKHDRSVRLQLVRNAQVSRAVFGWIAILFAGAFVWACASHWLRSGNWLPGVAIFFAFGFVGNLLVWDKFGDRIAAFKAMDDPASVTEAKEAASDD